MKQLFFRPVDPWFVSQPFGTNWACISDDNKTVITNPGTCPVGYRNLYGNMKGHNGLDLSAKRWQPIYASREGEVVEVQTEESRGLGIGIHHDFGLDGKWKTRYWHLASINVHLGDKVNTGDFIGYADSTGYSSGDHLHFEIKPQKEKNVNLYPDNGYFGAVDPVPLMLDKQAWRVNVIRMAMEVFAKNIDKLSDFLRYFKL